MFLIQKVHLRYAKEFLTSVTEKLDKAYPDLALVPEDLSAFFEAFFVAQGALLDLCNKKYVTTNENEACYKKLERDLDAAYEACNDAVIRFEICLRQVHVFNANGLNVAELIKQRSSIFSPYVQTTETKTPDTLAASVRSNSNSNNN